MAVNQNLLTFFFLNAVSVFKMVTWQQNSDIIPDWTISNHISKCNRDTFNKGANLQSCKIFLDYILKQQAKITQTHCYKVFLKYQTHSCRFWTEVSVITQAITLTLPLPPPAEGPDAVQFSETNRKDRCQHCTLRDLLAIPQHCSCPVTARLGSFPAQRGARGSEGEAVSSLPA